MANWWQVGLDTTQLERDKERAKSMIADLNKSVLSQTTQLDSAFRNVGATIAGVFTIRAASSFVNQLIRVRSEFQGLSVAFNTMLGNKEKADALMGQMVKTAALTPFSLTEVASGAKQLLAYQVAVEDVNDTLVRLGNISSGLSVPLSRLILVYGQVRAKGRLMGDDLRQFTEAGVPMVHELAKQMGVADKEVQKMVSNGKIGFNEVDQVIKNLTNSGGMFYNLMAEKSKTLEGQISNLSDAFDVMLNELGKSSQGVISGAISGAAFLVENYQAVGEAIAVLVGAYGTYKAAIIAQSVAQQVSNAIKLEAVLASRALTVSEGLAAAATTSLSAAWRALNASMLANPFVLAAAALATLTYGIYKLATAEEDSVRVQREFNDEMEKAKELRDKLSSSSAQWVSTIKDETKSIYEQAKALKELKGAFPEAFKDTELSDIKKMTDKELKVKIGVELDNLELSQAENKVKAVQDKINKLSKIDTSYSPSNRDLAKRAIDARIASLNTELSLAKDQVNKIREIRKEAEFSKLPEADKIAYYNEQISKLKDQKAQIENIIDSSKRLNGLWEDPFQVQMNLFNLKRINDQINLLTGKVDKVAKSPTVAQTVKEAQGKIKDAQSKLKELRKASSIANKEEIEGALAIIKDEKAKLELYTGTSSKKSTSGRNTQKTASELKKETAEYNNLLSDQKQERIRAEQDLEMQVAQARIDAMKDSSDKTLAQMKLDHQKEIQVIERQREDLLSKKTADAKSAFEANPSNKKKVFSPSGIGLSKEENENFEAILQSVRAKNQIEEDVYYKQLTDKYQDYSAQRASIEKKFNDDIAALRKQREKAQSDSDKEAADRAIAQATKNKGQELMGFDFEQLKKTPEYVRAFENLKYTSSETLNSLLAQLEKSKKAAAQVLDPNELREYTTTISEIISELDERNPFKAVADAKLNLASANKELAEAANMLNGMSSGEQFLDEAGNIIAAEEATSRYAIAKDKAIRASVRLSEAEIKVNNALKRLTDSISQVGASIGGVTGDIIGMIGDIGSTVLSASTSLKLISKTTDESIKTIEKASVVLAIISAAFQIGSKIAKLFKNDDKEQYEAMKANYESLIGIWDSLIDRKLEYLGLSTGQEALQAEREALDLINKQVEAARQLAIDRLKVRNGGHSMEYRMWAGSYKFGGKNWDDVADEISRFTGKSIKSMRDFTELNSKDLSYIQENYSGFWSMMDTDFRKQLESIIKYGEKAEEVANKTKESLTQSSFGDIRNNFLDMLSDMDQGAEEAASNIEGYLQKMILNGLMDKSYKERLSKWYEEFTELGKLNSSSPEYKVSYDKVMDGYTGLVKEAVAERDKLKDVFGWKGEGEKTKGVTGELQKEMTEGTASQLVGLWNMTAMDVRSIKDTMQEYFAQQKSKTSFDMPSWVSNILDQTKLIQVNTLRTANNTDGLISALNSMKDELSEIRKNTRPNTSRG